MFCSALMMSLWTVMVYQPGLPPYFVKIVQERTLFGQDEAPMIYLRFGNQTRKILRKGKFPDLIKNLRIEKDGKLLTLQPKVDTQIIYSRVKSLDLNEHHDFRINLKKWFTGVDNGVFKVSYADEYSKFEALPIKIIGVDMPDLDSQFVLKTDFGDIVIELEAREAPNHARNFAVLAASSFYENMIFHRVVPNLVIQTGDPLGTGMGGSGYPLMLETSPFLKHKQYTVGMARGSDPNSGQSQIYICLSDVPALDRDYTVFGKVVEGFEAVQKIGAAPIAGRNDPIPEKPLEDIRLQKVEIRPKPDAK